MGGGVSGLATAFYIRRLAAEAASAIDVTVLESESRPGGRVWTNRVDGFQIESGANGFLDNNRATIELCANLELDDELITANESSRARYVFWNDRLHEVPTGPRSLWRSQLLSARGKLRLLAERLVPRRRDAGDESVHAFAVRRFGREAAEVLVDAMVTGIHAGDAQLLSLPAAFPRMAQLEREYGSLFRAMPRVRRLRMAEARAAGRPLPPGGSPGGQLHSLRGGMGRLIERLAESCGRRLSTGTAVRAIEFTHERQWSVRGDGRDYWAADALVLACPSFVQARLIEPIDPALAAELDRIAYNSVVVVGLGFRNSELPRSLDGFGYLTPQRTRRDVLGVLWSSSIFGNRAPDGAVLLQCMCGGWNRPEIVGWPDARVLESVRRDLAETLGISATPIVQHIHRWPQAIPQYQLGHLQRVSRIEQLRQRHAGLFLTGNCLRGVAVNDCTAEARRCAAEVVQQIRAAATMPIA